MSDAFPLDSLLFEVTQHCNHACLHCYNVWRGERTPLRASYPRGELGTADTVRLLEIALDQTGCRSVTLTGGEPLLRTDLPVLLRFLQSRNVRVTLISNGRLIDENAASTLIDLGVGLFELPLLSYRREVHDRLSAAQGAWEGALAAMANIRLRGGQFASAFVATRLNIADLYGTMRLAFAFGARAFMFNRFNPGGRGRLLMDTLLPSIEQVRDALMVAEAASVQFGIPVACSIPIPPCLIDTSGFSHIGFGYCAAGTQRAYCAVDPLGNVRPCNHSPLVLGNLFTSTFAEMFASEKHADFLKRLPPMCAACPRQASCRAGCRAAAQACYGAADLPEPFLRLGATSARRIGQPL